MELKKEFNKNVLESISKIYTYEKQINEKIIEIQRTNANLLNNQRDLAKIVISIDKQQQRIINQMNFIANKIDKLDKDTDLVKEEQIKMNEFIKLNSSAEQQNANTFKMLKEEIFFGNKETGDKINKIKESIEEVTSFFHKFNSTMNLVNKLAIGKFRLFF